MVRLLGLSTFLAVHSIIFILMGLFLTLFDKKGRLIHFYVTVPWAKVILWASGVRLKVNGLENVDDNVPRIYISNHQSYFDIFALFAALPIDFKYVLKEELTKIPLFGSVVVRAGHISIDRKNPRKALKSMREAAQKIRNGISVVIFPEGTRSVDGMVQPFKRGSFRMALQSGCELVPVAIINSRNIMSIESWRINRGPITINIGKPISATDYAKRDTNRLMAFMRETIIAQMNDVPEPPPRNEEKFDTPKVVKELR